MKFSNNWQHISVGDFAFSFFFENFFWFWNCFDSIHENFLIGFHKRLCWKSRSFMLPIWMQLCQQLNNNILDLVLLYFHAWHMCVMHTTGSLDYHCGMFLNSALIRNDIMFTVQNPFVFLKVPVLLLHNFARSFDKYTNLWRRILSAGN